MFQTQREKTHRVVTSPTMTARFLADYMAAGDQRRRSIVRDAKFQPLVRLPQHQEAKQAIGTFLRGGCTDVKGLADIGVELRERSVTSDFERTTLDNNASYIEHFLTVYDELDLPDAKRGSPGTIPPITLHGTKVTLDICLRLRRVTKTNITLHGLATLRYTKGKRLPADVAAWQSALLWGYLSRDDDQDERAERKLCLTIDAYTGTCYPAPGSAKSQFKNIQAACRTIADTWDHIDPPPNAIL